MTPTPTPSTPQRRGMATSALLAAAAIAVILVVMLVAVGCGSNEPESTPTTGQAHNHDEDYTGTPGLPDADAPTGVLNTALSAIFSWEPTTDSSPTDALARSSNYLTGAAATSARDTTNTVRASAEWGAWRQAGDLITARVDNAQATVINPAKAVGRATVIQTVLHLDGGSTPYQRFTAAVELVRTADGWKLATYPDITNTTTG